MKTDLYTKAVLSVIALALSGIAIQLATKDAHAQQARFRFTRSGALMVTQCNFGEDGQSWVLCKDVDGTFGQYLFK
jgi:hypothetical protein